MRRLALAALFAAAALPASAQRTPRAAPTGRVSAPLMADVAVEAAAAPSVLDPALRALDDASATAGKTSAVAMTARRMQVPLDPSGRVGALVELAAGTSVASLEALGAEVTGVYGDIVGVRLPVERLGELGRVQGVRRAQAVRRRVRPKTLNSRAEIRADLVHAGQGLSRPVTGVGAVVGDVDSGVDLGHPDFWTAAGRSRFLAVRDDLPATDRVYTRAQIEANRAAATAAVADSFAHGTHVIGTAGGGGILNPQMKGIAPGADLVMVRSTFQDDAILSGCAFVFAQARAVSKPAVCNLSLGGHFGPHDGSSLLDRGLSNIVQPGYFVVASAGNEGNDYVHAGQAMTPAREARTLYVTDYFSLESAVDAWYDPRAVTQIQVIAYEQNDAGQLVEGARSPVFAVGSTPRNNVALGTGGKYGFVSIDAQTTADAGNGDGHFYLQLSSDEDNDIYIGDYYYEIAVKGTAEGRVDLWDLAYDAPAYFYPESLGATAYDEILGGRDRSVGEPATALRAISVGSYANTLAYTDFTGKAQTWTGFYDENPVRGQLSTFSSRGPTRDGRRAPLVTAPGELVFAPFSALALQTEQAETSQLDASGKYLAIAGTSMSAPHVSGMLALMLDMNPALTYEQAVTILQTTSRRDAFTGAAPSDSAGYGKIDALAAVQAAAALASGVEEDARATGLALDRPSPNPLRTSALVRFAVEGTAPVRLALFDVLGREVAVLADGTAVPGRQEARLDASTLAPGTYLLRLTSGTQVRTQRVVVAR